MSIFFCLAGMSRQGGVCVLKTGDANDIANGLSRELQKIFISPIEEEAIPLLQSRLVAASRQFKPSMSAEEQQRLIADIDPHPTIDK